jgi:hypothetical protein
MHKPFQSRFKNIVCNLQDADNRVMTYKCLLLIKYNITEH